MPDENEAVEGQQATSSTLPCAQCGAELEFKPGQGTLKCNYCGHTQQITFKEGAAVIEYDLNDAMARYLGRTAAPPPAGVHQIKCQECGAEIVIPSGEQTARCDYCGSRKTVDVPMPAEVLRPESILPFRFDAASAEERFRHWLKGLWFRPNALKSRNTVEELNGIYAPYWTFDSHTSAFWTAQRGDYYYVTEYYTDSQGKRRSRQSRRTRWTWVSGSRRDHFDDWLVCASGQLRERLAALVHAIEPFPTRELVPYEDKFLAGFRAERYSVDLSQGWDLARNGIYQELTSRCAGDIGGDTYRALSVRASYFGQSFKLALLPLFVLAYRYNNKVYNVLINGATGEVQGQAPLSWVKIALLILAILAVVGGALGLYAAFGQ
ncbi:zinc ribbon domain-containing protein [bacterium]|nr:MAG: zinc ribbon domain-containing protein [bacterium]RIK63188.1 MAG: zinc ribbon domain-containing protein [Planctomycetota bacterium]